MKRLIKVLGLLVLFLISTNNYAQNKKTGKWFAQFEVGYGSSVTTNLSQKSIPAFKDIEYDGSDTVSSLTEYEYLPTGGNGVFIKTDFRYIKKSGWHYVLGVLYHQEFPSEFTHLYNYQESSIDYYLKNEFINTEVKRGYLTSRFGIGYETTIKRKMNFYFDGYVLLGTGWRNETVDRKDSYYDFNTRTEYLADVNSVMSSTLFQGRGVGISIETGGVLPINNNLDFILNLSITTFWYAYTKVKYQETWIVDGEIVLEEEQNLTGKQYNQQISSRNYSNFTDAFSNVGISIGLRYSLSK